MSKWVVGYISFFDNELKQVVVDASNWREALKAGESLGYDSCCFDDCEDLDDVGSVAFDMDSQLTCTEVR